MERKKRGNKRPYDKKLANFPIITEFKKCKLDPPPPAAINMGCTILPPLTRARKEQRGNKRPYF